MEEIILILFGLVIGSFLNVVISRLPEEQSIVKPRSRCPSCKAQIKFYDNIPIISYILLGGHCRNCDQEISLRYPIVEALTGFSFWLAYFYFGSDLIYMGFAILFLCLLISLAFTDMEHMILPNELTLGGTVVFLVYAFFNPYILTRHAYIASFGSALLFIGIYFFYKKILGKEGLGLGDVKMLLLLGAFLGINNLLVAILTASISGLLVGLFLIIFKGQNLESRLPFGTFLALGSYIALFWGDTILKAIHSFHRLFI